MLEPPVPHPDFLALVDQIISEHKEVARMVSRYYFNLVQEDIPPNHAVMLAGTYQKQLLTFLGREDTE